MSSKGLEMTSSAHGAERDRLGILAALLVLMVGFVTMFVLVRQGAELTEIKSQLKDMKAQMQEKRQWGEHLDSQVRPQGPSVHEQQNGAGRGKSATFLYGAEVHRRAKRSVSNIRNFANKITIPTTLGGCLAGERGEPGRDGRDGLSVTGPTGPPCPPGPPGSCCCSSPSPAHDCAEYHATGQTTSGVYTLDLSSSSVEAYCDMEDQGGGWTVIQRRQDGSVPFNRNWEEYKLGFGNKNGEYWIGNENIRLLTKRKNYKLRITLEDWNNNTRFAEYSTFRVSGEGDGYRLHLSGYSGNAGDSMAHSNGHRFSTVDRDNDDDRSHCSQHYGQAGWWFRACSESILNGRYLGNCESSCPLWKGVVWNRWTGRSYSLKSVSMKIRP
ncbi:microfibril-associated glycoprotein 4-like [Branchiostoma floridae x Branchiostoma japonicum]